MVPLKGFEMATTAYSYVRFSSAAQELGDSIRRQTQAAKDICQRNGWALDESLKPDKGISAWKGKNRQEGSLAAFYRMIEAGRIDSGSVLIVENLDRLSREKPTVALSGLLQIINAGVKVHTTQDGITYDEVSANENGGMKLMASILQIGLANQESEKKSERVSKAWRQKRLNAANGNIVTGKIPAWVRIVNGNKMELIPEKVAILKKICKWVREGFGYLAIAHKLNDAKIAKFGPGPCWMPSDVHYLFDHKKLIGEYRTKIDGKVTTVADYYPAVLTESEFNEIQAILATRKKVIVGRGSNTCPNLFGTLMHDEYGSRMILHHNGKKNINHLQSTRGIAGGGKTVRFPYGLFERHFLAWMGEITVGESKTPCPVDAGEIGRITAQIAKLEKEFETNPDVSGLIVAIKNLSAKRAAMESSLNAWKMQQSRGRIDTRSIGNMLAKDNSREMRIKVRAAIASMVNTIKLTVLPFGSGKCGMVDVEFFNGESHHIAILVKRLRHGLKSESLRYDDMADLRRQLDALMDDERLA